MPYRALAYAALLVLGLALASAQATGEYPLQACSANYLPRGSQCQVSSSSSASNDGGANSGICQLGLVCSLWSASSSGDSNDVNRNSRESNGNNNNGNGGTPKDPFCLLRTAACLAGTGSGSGSNTGGGSSNNGSNQNGTCAVRPVVGDACTDQLPCFDAVYNVTCRNGMCVYHNFLVAGEACNPDPLYFNGGCAGSLTCTNGVCGPATADGAQCSTGASNCGAGSYCNGARGAQSGVCTAFLATGGACTGSYQCAPGNICVRQASGNGNQGVCTALANIATPAIIGQQLESLATTAALAKPSSFLQNCSNSFDCQLGFRCVCNGTQNICLRVNHTAVAETTLDWLACIQAAGCPDPLRLEPGASITFGPGSCWEARCCQQTAAYFGITNPKCPAAATEAPAPAPATAAPTAAPVTAAPTTEPITASTSAAAGSVTSGTTSGTTSGATTGASSATTGATSAATSAATGAGSVATTGVATTGSITTGVSPASRRRM